MLSRKIKSIFITTFSLLLAVMFCSTSIAAISNTDSKGSYSYGESKKEGSKSKSPASTRSHGSVTKKGEGSGSKATPHKGGYSHGKKGHGHKSYAPSSHGYKPKGKEGSGSKKYSHGSPHKKSHSAHKGSGHGSSHRSGKSPFEHVLCFTKKLGLTAEQVEKIKAHEFEFKKMKIQRKADHAIAHMELDRLAHSATVDEAGMRSVGNRIVEIKSRKIQAMIEAKITILKILTAEQRQKVSKMHSRH
jgi:Spy/CpxP family protein refolding chaperone